MGKILGLAVQNYASLKNIKMGRLYRDKSAEALGNMVTIVGRSGNGKSTLADMFSFISESLAYGVEAACNAQNRGGYSEIVSCGSKKPIHFEILYKESAKSAPVTYELTIAADKNGVPHIKEELLREGYAGQHKDSSLLFMHLVRGKGYCFEGNEGGRDAQGNDIGTKNAVELSDDRKPAIATLGALKQYARVEQFLSFIRSWYLCCFSLESAREIPMAAPAAYLNRSGNNLNNAVRDMYLNHGQAFQKIVKCIQSKIPTIERVKPVKLENGQVILEFYQKSFDKPFSSRRISDGTLKLLAYYLLMHEKNPRQLVFIEEPENVLYHEYLADLAHEMFCTAGSGYSKQLFVTTHSPFFVSALPASSVWVFEKGKDGFSTAKRTSDYPLVQELTEEGLTLGDLWHSEYFG